MVRTHSRCLALLQAGQCHRVPNVPTRFFCSVALYHVSRTAVLLRAEEVVKKRGAVQLDPTGLPVLQREINSSDSDSGATFPSEVHRGEESSGDDDPSSAAADVSENSEGGSSRDLEEEKAVMQSGEEEEEGRRGDGVEDADANSQSEATDEDNDGSSDDSRASGRGMINAAASRKRSRRRSAEFKRRRKRKLEGGGDSDAPRGSLQLARDKSTRRRERGYYNALVKYGQQR